MGSEVNKGFSYWIICVLYDFDIKGLVWKKDFDIEQDSKDFFIPKDFWIKRYKEQG